jgi:hypothetical protein
MKFLLFTAAFAAVTLAAPTSLDRRAVFKTQTYNDLSISGGVAGNAKQEALDVLSGLPTDLTKVEEADLDFLNSVNQIANDAEKEAFNPAIEAAADDEAEDALQVCWFFFSFSRRIVMKRTVMHANHGLLLGTAGQNKEQGSQAHCDNSEVAGAGGAGPRCGRQAGDGTEEAG